MTNHINPERRCGNCGARFSWTGRQWVVADAHGRLSYPGVKRAQPEPAPLVTRCPACHASLDLKGTVTEVLDE